MAKRDRPNLDGPRISCVWLHVNGFFHSLFVLTIEQNINKYLFFARKFNFTESNTDRVYSERQPRRKKKNYTNHSEHWKMFSERKKEMKGPFFFLCA